MHFDNSFSNERCAEKRPKGHKKVATCDACEIEEGVRDGGGSQNAEETYALHQIVHKQLAARHKVKFKFLAHRRALFGGEEVFKVL